jgi:uncharacterized protein YbjT (DUF2867 family)
MSTILVTGGTGTLGRLVAERLRADGHEVRVLSRHSRPYAVDLREGGPALDAALDGVDTVVHCASTPTGGDVEAVGHRRAGAGHLVLVSIVGVDRVPLPYYRTKLAVERHVERSGLGWTILRATQFHDLLDRLFRVSAKLPVLVVPAGVCDQPVEAAEVADRLAELAVGAPAGRVPDLGGPEVRDFPALAAAWLKATGKRRGIVRLPLAGRTYRAFRAGGHLTPGHALGKGTFEEWLNRRYGTGS